MNQVVRALRVPAAILLLCSMLMAFVNVPKAGAAMNNTYGQPEFLLSPIQSSSTIAIYDSVIGQEGGANVLYTTLSGDPAVFFVIDLDNYTVVRSLPMPGGAKDIWTHVVDPDGNVYIASTNGKLFRYEPGAEEIEDLGVIIPGEGTIYGLNADENGNIYGGTYPNGRVWKYNPQTDQFTDYGTVHAGHAYVRSLAYYNGKLYAGLGTQGRLYEIDAATGDKTEIPLPPVAGVTNGDYPFVYQLDVISDGSGKDYLFAHLSGNGISTLIVYDLTGGEWRDEQFPDFHGNRTYGIGDGKAYFKLNGNGGHKLVEIDLATFQTTVTDMVQDFSLKGGGIAELNDPAFPGKTLVNIRFDGKVGFFNLATGTYTEKPAIVQGQPIPVHNIEKGPDGKFYMSGYPGGSAAIYDPATGANTVIPMGQAESIGFVGNYAYFNVYPHAEIYRVDITNPTAGSTKVFTIGEEQDRPYISLTVGSTLYLGTIPDYGKLGGALVVHDTTSNPASFEVYRNVVQDQSIVGLAYKDGKIYGSTTIVGGLNATPTATAAKIFVWDTATKQKVAEVTPNLPGKAPTMISGLTFDEDGLLWAAANGTIFAVDPDTLQVVKSKEIYPNVVDYGMWRPIHMRWGTDGLLYTDLYGKLTVFNTKTLEFQDLGVSSQLFTLGNDNHIYYIQGTKLYKIKVTQGDNSDDDANEPESAVFNGSFEKPVVGGVIPGWSLFFDNPSSNVSYEVTNAKAFSGSYSLKVVDNSTAEPIALISDPIDILPGETYTTSVHMFIETGRGSLLARFYDENGTQVGTDMVNHVQTGQGAWQQVTVSGTAPANAKTIRVFASISQGWTGTIYYDDFDVQGNFPPKDTAPGTFELAPSASQVEEGAEFTVKVNVADAKDLYALTAVVTYDPQTLEIEGVTAGSAFASNAFFASDTDTPGVVKIVATKVGSQAANGDAEAAVLTFTAKQEAQASAITLTTASQLAKIDADTTQKVYSPDSDVTVQVKIVKEYADVNGDGKVDMLDLVAVAKRVGGAYDAKYDMNGDNVIDINDVAIVALKVLKK
jgi:WD40 repeat protein